MYVCFIQYFMILWPGTELSVRDTEMLQIFFSGNYSLVGEISNQSILKEINPEYSLKGLMLKLELQYFGHLILGKIEGRRKGGDTG